MCAGIKINYNTCRCILVAASIILEGPDMAEILYTLIKIHEIMKSQRNLISSCFSAKIRLFP